MDTDWYGLGEEVKDIVQSALETGDFRGLSDGLGRTLNRALDQVGRTVEDTVRRSAGQWEYSRRERRYEYRGGPQDTAWEERQDGSTCGQEAYRAGAELAAVRRERYAQPGKALGVLMTAGGVLLAGFNGLGVLGAGVCLMFDVWMPLGYGAFFLLMTAAGAGLAAAGLGRLARIRRFKRCVDFLGFREYCSLEELASATGKTRDFVRRDIRKMIGSRMFRQGHLDRQESTLMVTDAAYRQYMALEEQTARREQEKKEEELRAAREQKERQPEDAAEEKPLSEEARRVIEAGERYIKEIRRSNDAIPGEEVSAKIYRLEVVTGKIFDRVEEHPELIPDLKKFMDYYLPTTMKLLKAYEEMDSQPVQGANIKKSKEEIENSLDMITQAFENLLDSFFEDTAWDVSSDISVLQTMLAQEGLTGGAFEKKEK